MNSEQVERAERVAARLEARRMRTQDWLEDARRMAAEAEAKEWRKSESIASNKKPKTLATRRQEYTFTDEQFRIALASLDKKR